MGAYSKTENVSDELLVSRIEDIALSCEKNGIPRFCGFFDARQKKLALKAASRYGFCRFKCWGGYPEAERVLIGVLPGDDFEDEQDDGESRFPVVSVKLKYPERACLTHRDILGAIMSLGLKRDAVGDILIFENFSVVYLKTEMLNYVLSQFDRIGRYNVKCEINDCDNLPIKYNFKEIRGTIASERIDCALSCLLKLSRSNCVELIKRGHVKVEYETCESPSRNIKKDYVITVAGHGKYIIVEIGPQTRKGRYNFLAKKYV